MPDGMDISFAIIETGARVETQGLDTPVPWWSFTKTATAAAALVLVRDGRLALDEKLPDRRYTVRQLLQHRAGLTDYGGLAAYHAAVARGDEPWSAAELLEHTHADDLRYAPGQGWGYSNIGYLFVRQRLEEICGEDLDAILRRLVLRPLGIDDARVAQGPADLADVAMGAASSYHPGWAYPGFLVGRLSDAALLLHRLTTGDLLPPDLLDQMLAAHRLGGPVPGRPWSAPGYGLGLMSGATSDGRRAIGHTGAGPGSVIAVYHLPEATPPFTAAAFAFGDDQGSVESAAFGRGRRPVCS